MVSKLDKYDVIVNVEREHVSQQYSNRINCTIPIKFNSIYLDTINKDPEFNWNVGESPPIELNQIIFYHL